MYVPTRRFSCVRSMCTIRGTPPPPPRRLTSGGWNPINAQQTQPRSFHLRFNARMFFDSTRAFAEFVNCRFLFAEAPIKSASSCRHPARVGAVCYRINTRGRRGSRLLLGLKVKGGGGAEILTQGGTLVDNLAAGECVWECEAVALDPRGEWH